MKYSLLTALILFLFSFSTYSNITPHGKAKKLLERFSSELKAKELTNLQRDVLLIGGKSVPALVKVMKGKTFPDKNRWVATFLLGKVMGKKSAPYLSKYLEHPNWVLRLASLKTLLALKQKSYAMDYAKSLEDDSFLIRKQALENIRHLKLKKAAPYVWSMLYDKRNYYANSKAAKRTNLIKEAIKTVGVLEFEKAKEPLLTMVQKDKYRDIFSEIDYSLEKITGKKSPEANIQVKRRFWKKLSVSLITIK